MISIRERRQVDLFDLAVVVIRRRPRPLLAAMVAGVAPFLAGNAWLLGRAGPAAPGVGLLLWWLEAPMAMAPLTLVLGGMMFGRTPSLGECVRKLAAASGTLLIAHGLLRFVPLYWLPPRLVFANEIILLEQARWTRLWRRGADLAGGRDGDFCFLAIAELVAVVCFALGAYFALRQLLQGIYSENLTWDLPESSVLTTLGFQCLVWVGVAFATVVRFLTYIDQRIRLEGWEIKLRLQAAGESFAETRRW